MEDAGARIPLLVELKRALIAGYLLVVGAGVAAEVLRFSGFELAIADALSLSLEANIPTWYASVLLFACAALLVAHGRRDKARWRAHWLGLAFAFVCISMDEVASFHERLNGLARFGGALFFGWVVPFGVLVLVIGLLCVPFLRALPPVTRTRFVTAGALYVGGALGVELVLGWWTEQHGAFNLTYRMIDAVEEGGELAGVSVFLWSLAAHHLDGARAGAPLSGASASSSAAASSARP